MRRARKQVDRQFEELKAAWQAEVEAGRLQEALELIGRALEWAESTGDVRKVDATLCARAAITIHLGRGEEELPKLREILLRSSDIGNARLASYHLSIYYQFAENYKKSLFYARLALDRSKLMGRQDWLASSYNQLGNALLGENYIDQAFAEYERSLSLMPPDAMVWRSSILNNLGYCHLLQGNFNEGFVMLRDSLRLARRAENQVYQILPHLDLAYAHLERGRYRDAHRHATSALALAERLGERHAIRNALYLLGETANMDRDENGAWEYFSRLHSEFYPEFNGLPQFLMAVDVRKLVNLHA
jgi:tetratricopeptide (TPR) repeat protein